VAKGVARDQIAVRSATTADRALYRVSGSAYGTDVVARSVRESVVVHRRITGISDNDMDGADPPAAKAITALLREARSLSRRADKLGGTAAAVGDPTTQQLAVEACTSMEQLVHHLTVLESNAACSDARRPQFVEIINRCIPIGFGRCGRVSSLDQLRTCLSSRSRAR
jgi:hypothetical protein